MRANSKSYSIEICNGPKGCANAVDKDSRIADAISEVFEKIGFDEFVKGRAGAPIRKHHVFTVSISFCPNACSRPQISDIGLIGAESPQITGEPCSGCGACVSVCIEGAIALANDSGPDISGNKCLSCGKCIRACPTGAIESVKKGFRIQVGGKLGRRPRLADELSGIFTEDDTVKIIERCLNVYMENYKAAKRFADLLPIYGKKNLFKIIKK